MEFHLLVLITHHLYPNSNPQLLVLLFQLQHISLSQSLTSDDRDHTLLVANEFHPILRWPVYLQTIHLYISNYLALKQTLLLLLRVSLPVRPRTALAVLPLLLRQMGSNHH